MIPRVPVALALLLLTGGGSCGEVAIPAIQGRSHLSPFAGRHVRSAGIVTAVGREWIHVQDPSGDGDPATSDAVLLRNAGAPVRPGDEVRFTGVVVEFVPGGEKTANLSLTTVDSGRVKIERRGRPLPPAVIIGREGRSAPAGHVISPDELPVNLRTPDEVRRNRYDPAEDAIDFYESLEGMRVTVRLPVAVSATETFTPRQSQIVVLPDGGAGVGPSRRTRAGGLLLQPAGAPGRQNPQRIFVQLDSALFPGSVPLVRVGDRLGDVHGVLRYNFGHYEVAATDRFGVTRRRDEPTAPPRPSETGLTITTYNVLNLSATEADREQRRLLAGQIVSRLGSPDILALQEVQDSGGEADDGVTSARGTLEALRDAVHRAGGPRYQFFDVAPADGRPGGAPGGNIRNAFLYRADRVRLIAFRSLTPGVLARAGAPDSLAFMESRDPLEGTFQFRRRRLRVVNNHLTSRYGSSPVFGAVQPFVEAGAEERQAQARALHDYSRRLLSEDPGAELVVLGDMNTFEFSTELTETLPGRPALLTALIPRVAREDRYTYNFEGNAQALDHVFVSPALRARARPWVPHLNTLAPAVPGRTASDHDPVLVTIYPPQQGETPVALSDSGHNLSRIGISFPYK